MDKPQRHHAKSKKRETKSYKVHDPIYMKCSETANLYSQKADQWLPKAERKGSINYKWAKENVFLDYGNVLNFDYGDACIIL